MRTDKVLTLLAEQHKAHAEERQEWAQERRSLLDRIQAPEIRQVALDSEYVDPVQPFEDGVEMARVGQVLYDPFVRLVSAADQAELDKVGTIIGMEA